MPLKKGEKVISLECYGCPVLDLWLEGKFKSFGLGGGRVLKQGAVTPDDFRKTDRIIVDNRTINLSGAEGRLSAVENLPVDVEGFYNDSPYYLTTRYPFTTADWDGASLTLIVPEEHAVYGEYSDDNPPLLQFFERSGSSGSYIYTPVVVDYNVTFAFRAARLIGSTTAESSVSNWQTMTNGQFYINTNGQPRNLTSLSFASALSMADVVAVINTALTGAICSWDTDHFEFVIDSSSGATIISYLQAALSGAGTDLHGPGWLACAEGQSEIIEGISGQWVVTVTLASGVTGFDGVMEVG